jgi:hypothetical protein
VWRGRPLTNEHHLPIGKPLRLDAEDLARLEDQKRRLPRGRGIAIFDRISPVLTRLLLGRKICPEANHFHVTPSGQDMICSLYMTFFYGKYPETPMREIWKNATHLAFQRDIHRRFLPMCAAACGNEAEYYIGNPRQLAGKLLSRIVPSPFRQRPNGTLERQYRALIPHRLARREDRARVVGP